MAYFLPTVRKEIVKVASAILGVKPSEIVVEDAPERFGADLAIPCFASASKKGKSPESIASHLAGKLVFEQAERIEATGGYVNIWLKTTDLAKALIKDSQNKVYGTSDEGKNKTIVVDFIGLNLSKPFSVGHLRPTVQGWAVIQIYKALGYKVIGDSHLGDWGTPFGMWVVGFKKWGSEEKLAKGGVYELGRLYVKFREASNTNEKLLEQAKAWLKKLESGDEEALDYHKRFNQISTEHAMSVLEQLKVKADENLGESFYVESAQKLVDKLIKDGMAEQQDDGSVIVRLEEFGIDTPALLRKGDGSVLYLTTDLETIRYRIQHWDPAKIIYSVGGEQQLHFKQVFAVAKKLGWDEEVELEHAWFGSIDEIDEATGKRGKMSSRKNMALLEHLLEKAETKAKEMMAGDKLNSKDIKAIAVGAIKFNDFARPRNTNILFDWDSMFSLNGHSAAYIQYAAVRVGSILDKLKEVESIDGINYDWLAERELLVQLARYPEVIRLSAESSEPFKVADYVYKLAKAWNRYYEATPVKGSSGDELLARTWLLGILRQNFEHALSLLGIEVPGKM